MLKLFLWLRYLRKRRIVFLSIAAVAVSVSLLIVVASLFTGFIKAFEHSAVETIGDVVLDISPYKVPDYPALIEQLEQIDLVQAATGTLASQGLLHIGRGNVRAVNIWGIEPAGRARVTGFRRYLVRQRSTADELSFEVPGEPGSTGGYVGIGVLAEPNETTDDYEPDRIADEMIGRRLILTTGAVTQDQGPAGGSGMDNLKRKVEPLSISDIVFTGVHDLDTRFIYLPIERVQELLFPGSQRPLAGSIQIKLRPGADPQAAIEQIETAWRKFAEDRLGWPSYRIQAATVATAQELQKRYVIELQKQMGVLMLTFGVVSLSVIVLVFCIFYMIVHLKQKDIAVIKSCGSSSASVAWIFVGFGLCVGVIGSALGTALGCVITRNVNMIEQWIGSVLGLKLWKSSVYMFDQIPNAVNWSWVQIIVVLAVAAAGIGALAPAIVAARTQPVEVLRYE